MCARSWVSNKELCDACKRPLDEHPYKLEQNVLHKEGIVLCSLCGARMLGSWMRDRQGLFDSIVARSEL
jgi:hypothetical protein